MKTLWILGTAAFVSAAFADTTYTSASYVQEGLIAQWDGIDNQDTGTHVPSATTWKDLVGGRDLTLTSTGKWNAIGDALVADGTSVAASRSSDSIPASKTIEVVFRQTGKGPSIILHGGNSSTMQFVSLNGDTNSKCYFEGLGNNTPHAAVVWNYEPGALRCAAATFENPGSTATATFADGVARTDSTHTSGWYFDTDMIALGAWVGNRYPFKGEICAIRLYNTVLTAEQIAANHAVDIERFGKKTPTSADYVQDGLLAQWDGIDNAGTGTHNPAATVWKDLKGNLDMTLTSKGSWTNGNAFVALGTTAAAVGATAAPTYKTIEVVFKRKSKYARILFNSGDKKRMVVFDDNPQNASGNIVTYFTGNTSSGGPRTKSVLLPIHTDSRPDYGEIFFLAACYDDDGIVTDIFRDADPASTINWYNEWNAGPAVSVGGRNTSSEYPWEGEIFAIRLYSTRLTKAQLAHNHRIDCKRFFTSKSYIQSGLTSHWDGLDNAGFGVHNAASATWMNLVSGAQALTVNTGVWSDDALMCKNSAAAAVGSTTLNYNTLETVLRNMNSTNYSVAFSGGLSSRFLALAANRVQWVNNKATTDFNYYVTGRHALTWTSDNDGSAYVDGDAVHYGEYKDTWSEGSSHVQVGGRDDGNKTNLSGDFYTIRTYSRAITPLEVAYNAKIDRVRYGLAPRTLTWSGQTADFSASGYWTVATNTTVVPSVSDAVVFPAGNYTVTLVDETVVEALSIGAGAKLKMTLPSGEDATNMVPVTVFGAVTADTGAGLVLDAAAFDRNHPEESIMLVKCELNSTDALSALAENISFTDADRHGAVAVIDGVRLVYTAPSKSGFTLVVR